jgi:hypothetical protein
MDTMHLVSAYIMGSNVVYKPLFIFKCKFNTYSPNYLQNICKTYQYIGKSVL